MSDLITRLRALSRAQHSDLSIGDEAADELQALQAKLTRIEAAINTVRSEMYEFVHNTERSDWVRVSDQHGSWSFALSNAVEGIENTHAAAKEAAQ